MKNTFIFLIATLLVLSSCKKENLIKGNSAPDYYGVPTIKVKNYINRIFIDLTGREPLDTEMDSLVLLLENNNLNFSTRETVIFNLQNDTSTQSNGDSFKELFYTNIYEQQKARFLEAIPDVEISQRMSNSYNAARNDSLTGNMLGYFWNKEQGDIYRDVLSSDTAFRNGRITINEMCRRMCYNGIYDIINMNSFNYVNAVFDNLFYRFPTTDEFTAGYNMVEFDQADLLFGQPGSNKFDFSRIAVNTEEFNDGLVTWIYRSYLSRFPTTQETFIYSTHFQSNSDISYLIREVMKTDEYANF